MKRFACCLLFLMPCTLIGSAQVTTEGFRALHVDAGTVTGKIRSYQGMNGMPAPVMAGLPGLVRQYRELRVSQVRTHDVMGPTDVDAMFDYESKPLTRLIPDSAVRAAVVKSGNASVIFPDENADPDKQESYNFGPTDKMLTAIHASGAEVYYRIGRSWGANPNPPADFDRFANVVKHIVMHYNQGWANGFHYNVRYWEFWNEPGNIFWTGTAEQFYLLYEKTARALKSVDPTLKVGGDAIANPFDLRDNGAYREGFIRYCSAHNVPLDFYSWHTYANSSADPYDAVRLSHVIRNVLDASGFTKAESILSEWNLSADYTAREKDELQSAHNAAFIGAVLTYLQDAPLDEAMFYRGDAAWMGLFDLQGHYLKPAYAFKAMGAMLDTPQRFAVEGVDTFGFAVLAGRSQDGKKVQVLISNYEIPSSKLPKSAAESVGNPSAGAPAPTTSQEKSLALRTGIVYRDNAGYNLQIDNLPWGNAAFTLRRYRLNDTRNLELVEESSGSGGSLKLSNAMPTDTLDLVVLERR